jgi:hypothetical protein
MVFEKNILYEIKGNLNKVFWYDYVVICIDNFFMGLTFLPTRIPSKQKWLFQAVFRPSEGWRKIGSDPDPT